MTTSMRESAWNAYVQAAGPSEPVTPWTEGTEPRYPSIAEMNLLPDRFRRFVHDLQTRADPSGDVQTISDLREQVMALSRLVEELRAADPSKE